MDCMATIREAPPQLRQAAYATQPADAAGPNAATDDNHATRGEYNKHATRLLYISPIVDSLITKCQAGTVCMSPRIRSKT